MSEHATFQSSTQAAHDLLMYRQLAQKMDDVDGDEIATQGDAQMVAQSRNPVFTPQCLVTVTAAVQKGECKLRADAAKHNPSGLLAPHATRDSTHAVHKGFIVMHRALDGAGFQTHMNANAGLAAVATLNGETARTRFIIPGVAQVSSNPGSLSDGQAQTAVAIHGVQTCHNFGTHRVRTGDKLLVSRHPAMAKLDRDQNENGKYPSRVGPLIKGPDGCDEEAVYWPVIPLYGNTVDGYMMTAEEIFRLKMGTPEFSGRAAKIMNFENLYDLFHSTLDSMFNAEMIVDADDPIRGYMLLWAAIRWYNILSLEKASFKGSWATHMRLALMLRRKVLCDAEVKYVTLGEEYACSLPHDGDVQDAKNSVQRGKSNLAGAYLLELVGEEVNGVLKPTTADKMREAETRIRMHEQHMLRQFSARITAFINQYFFGTALSCADPGKSFDVMVGK